MRSLWSDADAEAMVARYRARGIGEDLGLRTYSARLLGADRWLVMHGGGNTSVKTGMADVFGENVAVLCIKGSGSDLATLEPAGQPAVRLEPLLRLRKLERLSDEDMVNVQRQNMLDTSGPNPSVETLLHAFIPYKFVDHTHATAAVALANQPDAEAITRALFGARVACVPYVMPGFGLAKAAGDAFDANPQAEGLLLLKHGLFTFGATAKESYERTIEFASIVEDYIAGVSRRRFVAAAMPAKSAVPSAFLPHLRGAFAGAAKTVEAPFRWLFDLRTTDGLRALARAPDIETFCYRGVATPDHVIRTKQKPLVLPMPVTGELEAWGQGAAKALANYIDDYSDYFRRNNARHGGIKRMLDPLPRFVLIKGVGAVGIGKSSADAAVVADIIEAWAESVAGAEAIGRFEPIGEADTFDIEYWSLEQAKLGKGLEKRLARHIAVVTGGASGIGAATARAFAAEGAEVAVLDVDLAGARRIADAIGGSTLACACDLTDRDSVAQAMAAVVSRFGGVDVLVSNAGAAFTGMIASMDDAVLRKSFELNFFGHQNVAQAAVALMKTQGTGGALLFNVSKQAINPCRDFGAYGTAKAALLALVRQYALEHGADGIRSNGLNPDRVRSGLLTDAMITSRAAARGVSEADYMSGNLLGVEVTANDVAQAFVALALLPKTTGDILAVDGGNVAAMLR